MQKGYNFSDSLSKNLNPTSAIPKPTDGDSPDHDKDESSVPLGFKTSKTITSSSQPRDVSGVVSIEELTKQMKEYNLEHDLTEFLVQHLQKLATGFATKSRASYSFSCERRHCK
ncbi:hypothetical protein AVEN_78206-1 [Araneus ventricosus]|uniref:Uncharacterized protein n=1 Tax=Araneus ventricosus TaxID=182803 RepID=A0A4Y2R8R5_ARAVE|nr:hypothetical protein AVEN_78206-1 [Araneus ventricosus]